MHYREVIRRPVVTEKTTELAETLFQYTFEVDPRANKLQIKEAVELIWPRIEVLNVRVMVMPPKRAKRGRKVVVRKPAWKKAVVTLAKGQHLEMFEGV